MYFFILSKSPSLTD